MRGNAWTSDVFIICDAALSHGSTRDSKVHGANMGPILGRQDPVGPHVGPMKFAIWDFTTWWRIVALHHSQKLSYVL